MTNLLLYGIKFMLFDLILKVVVVNKLVLWLCYVVIIKFFFVIFTLLKENHEYVFGYFFVYIFLCMLSFFYLIDTFFLNPVPHLISSFLWLCLSVWLTVCPNVFLYLFYGQFVLALRVSAGDPLLLYNNTGRYKPKNDNKNLIVIGHNIYRLKTDSTRKKKRLSRSWYLYYQMVNQK